MVQGGWKWELLGLLRVSSCPFFFFVNWVCLVLGRREVGWSLSYLILSDMVFSSGANAGFARISIHSLTFTLNSLFILLDFFFLDG